MSFRCTCGEPAPFRCTWKLLKYIYVPVTELVAGDRICRSTESGPRPGSLAIVDEVRDFDLFSQGRHRFEITLRIKREGRADRLKVIEGHTHGNGYTDGFKHLALAPCDAAVCEICAQDPGEPQKYCPAHWTIRTMAPAEKAA